MISIDAYQLAYKSKKAQVFAVSIRDQEFRIEKKAMPKNNQKSFILEKYYNFLNIFQRNI